MTSRSERELAAEVGEIVAAVDESRKGGLQSDGAALARALLKLTMKGRPPSPMAVQLYVALSCEEAGLLELVRKAGAR